MLLMPSCFATIVCAQGHVFGGDPKGRASFRGEVADIDVRKAGGLQAMIPAEKLRDIRQMHISGVINDIDLKFIKTLACRSSVKNARGHNVQSWLDLDLRHARIVRGDRYGRPTTDWTITLLSSVCSQEFVKIWCGTSLPLPTCVPSSCPPICVPSATIVSLRAANSKWWKCRQRWKSLANMPSAAVISS